MLRHGQNLLRAPRFCHLRHRAQTSLPSTTTLLKRNFMPSQQVYETKDGAVYTPSTGAPVAEPYAAERIGHFGPLLLQGTYHIF